jgi:hypothetical protein
MGARLGGKSRCMLEAEKTEQAASSYVLSDGSISTSPGLDQLRDRLSQQRFRFVKETDPIQNLSSAQKRDPVIVIWREPTRCCHLSEPCRSVAQHAQIEASIMARKGNQYRRVRSLCMPRGRKVIR